MPVYTPAALAVLDRARAEARRLGYPFIQRELLFLGLLADPTVDRILQTLGADARSIRDAVESRLPPALETNHRVSIGLLPTAEQVFRQRAQTAAALLDHSAVSTPHILMGFLMEQHGVVADILRSHGITLDRLMEVIRKSESQGG